jgi:hypothetical protein
MCYMRDLLRVMRIDERKHSSYISSIDVSLNAALRLICIPGTFSRPPRLGMQTGDRRLPVGTRTHLLFNTSILIYTLKYWSLRRPYASLRRRVDLGLMITDIRVALSQHPDLVTSK